MKKEETKLFPVSIERLDWMDFLTDYLFSLALYYELL